MKFDIDKAVEHIRDTDMICGDQAAMVRIVTAAFNHQTSVSNEDIERAKHNLKVQRGEVDRAWKSLKHAVSGGATNNRVRKLLGVYDRRLEQVEELFQELEEVKESAKKTEMITLS